MAVPTIVQSAKGTIRGGTAATSGSITVTTGNLLVLFGGSDGNLTSSGSPAITYGGTASIAAAVARGNGVGDSSVVTSRLWTAVVTTGGTLTVTLTDSAAARVSIGVVEVSGADTANPSHQAGGSKNTGTSTSPAVADISDTTIADCLVLGNATLANGATGTMSATTGWTGIVNASYANTAGGTVWPHYVVYKDAAGAGAYDPSVDISVLDSFWSIAGIAIAPAGGSFVPRRTLLGVG